MPCSMPGYFRSVGCLDIFAQLVMFFILSGRPSPLPHCDIKLGFCHANTHQGYRRQNMPLGILVACSFHNYSWDQG